MPKYITRLSQIAELSAAERDWLRPVAAVYAFRTNEYYQSLVDWSDPDDPIRRIVMPDIDELDEWGQLDASDEGAYTAVPGLQHKYRDTAVLLVNDVCGSYCRFCFRKRLFMGGNDEVVRDVTAGLRYIREHREIDNVLLTGGDPLIMSTRKLENIIRQLQELEHVQIIRIGSKMPAFNPYRILNDPSLLRVFQRYSNDHKKIYLIVHFNHPRELTDVAVRALALVQKTGVVVLNQTPLLRGVNDQPEVLARLLNKLSYVGVAPYYVFQCRPTSGNKAYAVPVEESLEIFEQAKQRCSGLARRARLVMSHATGKIEVLGKSERYVYLRYHRAADPQDEGRLMVFKRNARAYWFDDYEEALVECPWEEGYDGFVLE